MTHNLDDDEILALFNQGGRHVDKAFKALVSKHGDKLYSQIIRITGEHDSTNDILQNVLIKVYQNLSKFNQDSTLYTWLYRIARNETLTFIAKEKKHSGVKLENHLVEIVAGHQTLDNSSPEIISKLLQEAIDLLPEKQSMVFQMKYFDDLKYSEISAKLKTSEGALKANYHHAKNKIEEYILSQLNL